MVSGCGALAWVSGGDDVYGSVVGVAEASPPGEASKWRECRALWWAARRLRVERKDGDGGQWGETLGGGRVYGRAAWTGKGELSREGWGGE